MAFRSTNAAKGAEILAFAGVLRARGTPEALTCLLDLLEHDPDALYDALCDQVLNSHDPRYAALQAKLGTGQ